MGGDDPGPPVDECPPACPRCGGPFIDLRDAGFDPDALARERTCYLWTGREYACNQRTQKKSWTD